MFKSGRLSEFGIIVPILEKLVCRITFGWVQSGLLQQLSKVYVSRSVDVQQINGSPANRSDSKNDCFIFIPLKMIWPIVSSWVK